MDKALSRIFIHSYCKVRSHNWKGGCLSRKKEQKSPTFRSTYTPGFLKTGLAKISTHSTTWQFKTNKTHSLAHSKPLSDAGQQVNGP